MRMRTSRIGGLLATASLATVALALPASAIAAPGGHAAPGKHQPRHRIGPCRASSTTIWLGLGAGYEWLSFKALGSVDLPDGSGDTIPFQTTELIGGPELALSGGIDLEVEEALRLGPYATLSVGDYVSDHFKCEPGGLGCPSGSSLNGSGAHAWLSIGLRGSFSP